MIDTKQLKKYALGLHLSSLRERKASAFGDSIIDNINVAQFLADEIEFAHFLDEHKALAYLPLVSEKVKRADYNYTWTLFDCREEITKITLENVDPVYQILTDAGVETMAYKGTDLLYYYGSRTNTRFMADIDPLVRHKDLGKVDAALFEAGFFLGHINRGELSDDRKSLKVNPVPKEDIEWVRSNHHEGHPYFKIIEDDELLKYRACVDECSTFFIVEDRAFCLPQVDLHWSVASGVEEEDVWKFNTRRVSIPGGIIVPAASRELNLCLYAGRTYSIAYALKECTVANFVDTLRVLSELREIDWEYTWYLTEKYRIQAGMFYVLSWCNFFMEEPVDDRFLNRCKTWLEANREYDLGDFMPRILDEFVFSVDPKLIFSS